MHPFVIADLAEEIGEGSQPSVVLSEHALEGLLFEGGILRHELHIFVLSVEAGWVLRQRMVRNFRRRREYGLELRLFRFEFVDPLFQIGYRMFSFFHRAIFSIAGQR